MTTHDLFVDYFTNEPGNVQQYLNDCISLLVGEGNDRVIEFDGYFQERYEAEAENPVDFDEDYFDQDDRKKLYVYLCGQVDDEMLTMLQDAYKVAGLEAPTKEDLKQMSDALIRRGVRF